LPRHVREPARSTPVLQEKDVVVSGGGMAGVAAAVSAARCGADVLLIERYGFLGGMATAAFVDTIPPVAKGIGTEFESRIRELGAISTEKGFWASWDPEAIKRACFEIIEDAGVELLLHSYVAGVLVEGSTLTGVLVESKSGRAAVMGKLQYRRWGMGD